MQVCPGLCHRLKRMRERPNLVLNLFPPKQNVFHRNRHSCASQEVPSGLDEANSTPSRGFAQSLSLCDSFDGQAFDTSSPREGTDLSSSQVSRATERGGREDEGVTHA